MTSYDPLIAALSETLAAHNCDPGRFVMAIYRDGTVYTLQYGVSPVERIGIGRLIQKEAETHFRVDTAISKH